MWFLLISMVFKRGWRDKRINNLRPAWATYIRRRKLGKWGTKHGRRVRTGDLKARFPYERRQFIETEWKSSFTQALCRRQKKSQKHALQADAIQMYNRQHTPLRPDAVCAFP